MILIVAIVAGAAAGAIYARRRGGNAADIAQYAIGFAIAFGLVALFAVLIGGRIL